MSISISSNFDAGAIEVVNADNPEDIRLRVRCDTHSECAQWVLLPRLGRARATPCDELRERRAVRVSGRLARL